jgi:hypothetical protein
MTPDLVAASGLTGRGGFCAEAPVFCPFGLFIRPWGRIGRGTSARKCCFVDDEYGLWIRARLGVRALALTFSCRATCPALFIG